MRSTLYKKGDLKRFLLVVEWRRNPATIRLLYHTPNLSDPSTFSYRDIIFPYSEQPPKWCRFESGMRRNRVKRCFKVALIGHRGTRVSPFYPSLDFRVRCVPNFANGCHSPFLFFLLSCHPLAITHPLLAAFRSMSSYFLHIPSTPSISPPPDVPHLPRSLEIVSGDHPLLRPSIPLRGESGKKGGFAREKEKKGARIDFNDAPTIANSRKRREHILHALILGNVGIW